MSIFFFFIKLKIFELFISLTILKKNLSLIYFNIDLSRFFLAMITTSILYFFSKYLN